MGVKHRMFAFQMAVQNNLLAIEEQMRLIGSGGKRTDVPSPVPVATVGIAAKTRRRNSRVLQLAGGGSCSKYSS